MSLTDDPLMNAIYGGIKRDIELLLEAKRLRAALLLIHAGIDCLAALGMPAGQEEVKRDDFTRWADRYIQLPGREQLTGLELYASRCGLLHQYGTHSRLSREGKCREIGYSSEMPTPVRFERRISSEFVIVSVPALAEAFFRGIDRYVVDLFADPQRAATANERLPWLILELRTEDIDSTSAG